MKKRKTKSEASKGFSYISHLTTNLKCGADVDLGPKTLIVGPNGSGKSTIQQGIQFALRGRVCDVAGRREIADPKLLWALAPEDAKDLRATIETSYGHMSTATSSACMPSPTSRVVVDGEGEAAPSDPLLVSTVQSVVVSSGDTARKAFLELFDADEIEWKDTLPTRLKEAIEAQDWSGSLESAIDQIGKRVREIRGQLKEQERLIDQLGQTQIQTEPLVVPDHSAALAKLRKKAARCTTQIEEAKKTPDTTGMEASAAMNLFERASDPAACPLCGTELGVEMIQEMITVLKRVQESEVRRVKLLQAAQDELWRVQREIAVLETPQQKPKAMKGLEDSIAQARQRVGDLQEEEDLWVRGLGTLKQRLQDWAENAQSDFERQVNEYLPKKYRFGLILREGKRAVFRLGLYVNDRFAAAPSAGQWSLLLAAIGAAIAKARGLNVIVMPIEAGWSPEELAAVLEALKDAPCQIVMTSTVSPKVVPTEWKIITLA